MRDLAVTPERFSTRALDPSRQLAVLREHFEEKVKLAIYAEPGHLVEMTAEEWPGLRRARMLTPLTARMERLQPMLADGEESVCLMINTGGTFALRQLGREVVSRPGEAVLLAYHEPLVLDFLHATYLAVRVPAAAFGSMVEDAAARCIPSCSEAVALLHAYLAAMPSGIADPRLRRLSALHLYDLIALAIGTNTDQPRTAGVRAARLEALKAAIVAHPSVSLNDLAARHGVSPRYVQALFEEVGLTFSELSLKCRLESAKAMLTSPRFDGRSVASIAYDCGFNDLSYFNRCFKKRYRSTPSAMRQPVSFDQKNRKRETFLP